MKLMPIEELLHMIFVWVLDSQQLSNVFDVSLRWGFGRSQCQAGEKRAGQPSHRQRPQFPQIPLCISLLGDLLIQCPTVTWVDAFRYGCLNWKQEHYHSEVGILMANFLNGSYSVSSRCSLSAKVQTRLKFSQHDTETTSERHKEWENVHA